MGTIYTIWLREMKRFLRSRSRIVGNIAMPFMWLVLLGTGLHSSLAFSGFGGDYLAFLVPGIMGMSLLFTSIFSGVSVIWDKQFGFLREILVSPVSRAGIVVGKIAGSTTISIFNALIILVISLLLGYFSLSSTGLFGIVLAFLFMAMVCICFVSIGLIIASMVESTEGFQLIMSFLVMPVFFLSGAFFPLETTPLWLQALSLVNPLRYGVDGLRASLLSQSELPLATDLGIMLLFSIALILVASHVFKKIKI